MGRKTAAMNLRKYSVSQMVLPGTSKSNEGGNELLGACQPPVGLPLGLRSIKPEGAVDDCLDVWPSEGPQGAQSNKTVIKKFRSAKHGDTMTR